MQGDTIRIRGDRPASAIRFIGQNGTLLAEGSGAEAVYAFRKNDAYARAEAHFDDGTILFFNPFVWTADGNRPVNVFVPVVNYPLTVLCHLLWFALLAGLTALMLYPCRACAAEACITGGIRRSRRNERNRTDGRRPPVRNDRDCRKKMNMSGPNAGPVLGI